MAIITCPVCGFRYSDKLEDCPECAKMQADLDDIEQDRALEEVDKENPDLFSKRNIAIIVGFTIGLGALVAVAVPYLIDYDHDPDSLMLKPPMSRGDEDSLNLRKNWVRMFLNQRGGDLTPSGLQNGVETYAGTDGKEVLTLRTVGPPGDLISIEATIEYGGWDPWRGLAVDRFVHFGRQFDPAVAAWLESEVETAASSGAAHSASMIDDGRGFAFVYEPSEETMTLTVTPAGGTSAPPTPAAETVE